VQTIYSGTGTGVTSPVAGFAAYANNATATTTQTPGDNSTFSGWSGTCGCTGTDACAPTIIADCTTIATWTANTQYTLSVTRPSNGETVTADIGSILCGPNDNNCLEYYYTGAVATLTGTCATGWYGGVWTGDGTGTTTREFTMTSSQSVAYACSKTGGVAKVGTGPAIKIGTGAGMIIP